MHALHNLFVVPVNMCLLCAQELFEIEGWQRLLKYLVTLYLPIMQKNIQQIQRRLTAKRRLGQKVKSGKTNFGITKLPANLSPVSTKNHKRSNSRYSENLATIFKISWFTSMLRMFFFSLGLLRICSLPK